MQLSTQSVKTTPSAVSSSDLPELTLRGMLLGALITVIFTASNVYLGLKVGMTFASSIPAAVISMAVLKFFKGSNILENNMVQTQASSAGCLSSIIFVLPGMLMLGYWQGFPFWQTTLVCAVGGSLGVIFTIPLRHVMVVESDLPYPEGVAAAEILKTGDAGSGEKGSDSKEGFKLLLSGGLSSGLFAFIVNGLHLAGDGIAFCFKAGASIFNLSTGFSFARLGAGFLVGITGGIAILTGTVFAWGAAVPVLSFLEPAAEGQDIASYANSLWVSKVRFIGAGCIAISAVWTLIVLFRPLVNGIRMSMQAFSSDDSSRSRDFDDLSIKSMLWLTALFFVIIVATFYNFIESAGLEVEYAWLLVFIATLIAFTVGFMVASACGYMAGLIGSSSSPISGISIISIIVTSLIFLGVGSYTGVFETEGGSKFMTALAIFTVSVIIAISSISNDNLQDLKTGHLVGASPRLQQIALLIGCVVGAVVIAPVLELLYEAYGFTGAMPRPNMDPAMALGAPQATLMTTIANGIFSSQLDWTYIVIGIVVGAIVISIDLFLKLSSNSRLSLPPLAVGIGIYLPASINVPVFIGSLISYVILRHIRKSKLTEEGKENAIKDSMHRGTLLSAGFIVGESLIGVLMAFIIVLSVTSGGSESPLAIEIESLSSFAPVIGLMLFVLGIVLLYKKARFNK